MRKKVAVLVVVTVAVGLFYLWYTNFKNPEQVGMTASGTIEATRVELNAKVPGTLGNLSLRAGDKVKRGQLVGEITRNDLVAQKERDALGVLKAESQLADLTSGARAQEINEAAALVNIAQANIDKASTDLERGEQLFKEGAITQEQLERLTTDVRVKENQLEAARARLSLLQSGSRADAVKAASVELARSKAILKASEAMLEDTRIYAPIDGTVLTKNREQGEFIPAGASVATLANLDDMWIKVYVPTDDLPNLKLGQEVTFTVSGRDQRYKGNIEEISSQGEYTPKMIQTKKERTNIVFAVKIRITNEGGTLKPGMPADVTF